MSTRIEGTRVTITWERQRPGLEAVQELANRALKADTKDTATIPEGTKP